MATVDTIELSFKFNHIPVTSSNILSVAWDQHVLEVKFINGTVYRYFDIPEQVYLDLIDPDLKVSKKTYLKKRVIDARKPYKLTKNVP